jgi:hypothetical protein
MTSELYYLLRYLLTGQFATELPAPGPNEPLYRNVVGPNQVRSYIFCPRVFVSVNAYKALSVAR